MLINFEQGDIYSYKMIHPVWQKFDSNREVQLNLLDKLTHSFGVPLVY